MLISKIVDSTPIPTAPSSRIPSILPARSWYTWEASVGLGLPERFADGPATGSPALSINSKVTPLSGQRSATVSKPPVLSKGTIFDFFKMSVSGPGQKLSIRRFAFSGTLSTRGYTSSIFET